jgi:hypothetical protein
MTNFGLLQVQTAVGITLLFWAIIIFVLVVSVAIFIYLLRELVRETRLPGKRIFGFNCDMCDGKFRKNGKPLFRCYVKKPLLTKLIEWRLIKSKKE